MSAAALVVSVLAVIVSVGSVLFARRSASASERSATASEKSADEARKSRLEDSGPSVTAIRLVEDRDRWVLDPHMGHRNYLKRESLNPVPEYVLPREGDARIAVSCSVILRNEGSTTATIKVPESAVISAPRDGENEVEWPKSQIARPDGSYALEPSETCVVLVRQGITIEEWAVHSGSVVLTSTFSASNPFGTVTDEWTVKLTAHVLDPVHGDAARWREVAMVPTKAEISMPKRTYGD